MRDKKVRLTVLNNPFDTNDRIEYWLDYKKGVSVNDYISSKKFVSKTGIDLVYSLSGKILDEETVLHVCPDPYDQIVVVPVLTGGGEGDKDTGRMAAMLIVAVIAVVVTAGVGTAAAGTAWGGTAAGGLTTAGMVAASLAGMAVSIGGSLLINWLFPLTPPQAPGLPGTGIARGDMNQTDTYGWGDMRNTAQQGLPIPRIYGTRRIAGNLINQYTDLNENDQYYSALIALNDGQVQGVGNILVNGQSISSFNDVWQRVTLGTRNQEPLEFFTDTYQTQNFNAELTTASYVTKTTAGDAAQGIRIDVVCPFGLYYSGSKGSLDDTYVEISLEYQKDGTGSWTAIQAGQGGETTYTDYAYTAQGFKFNSEADSVTFTLKHAGRRSNRVIQYRLGNTYTTQDFGWIDFGSFTRDIIGYDIQWPEDDDRHYIYGPEWKPVTINGLGKQLVEVRIKMYRTGVLDAVQLFKEISRTINLGGLTGNVNIVGAQNSPLRRSYEVRNLDEAKYSVRAKVVGRAGTTTRYQNKIFFTGLAEIIPDNFAYPYVTLLGVRILASAQLSGAMPSISAEVTRSHTVVYDTNVSLWIPVRADNPAWACYDILVRPFYSLDVDQDGSVTDMNVEGYDGIDPATRIDYDAFTSWADWCDTETSSGHKRAVVDIVYDSQMSIWDALTHIAQVGRGMVVMRGTQFSCVVDKSSDPVQMFTIGNVYEDSFKETFLSISDRANIVEVTYFDALRNYQRETVTVYGNDWAEGGLEKRALITLTGCTTYDRAYREGIYRLNSNKYLQRTISFDVDVDALACQVGNVIRVQHDLPQWGYGGRVVSSTNSTVVLDQEVPIDGSSTYIVYVRHNDDTVENKTVTTASATTASLTISGTWTVNPERFELFSFGVQNAAYKLFRVIAITRSQELRRTITAVEYNESMYTEGDPVDHNVSALQDIPIASDIRVEERLKAGVSGMWLSEVHMSWAFYGVNERRLTNWEIYRKDTEVDDNVWEYLGTTGDLSYISSDSQWHLNHTYQVAICGVDLFGSRSHGPDASEVTKTGITILWKYAPPDDVSKFSVTQDGLDVFFTWDHIFDADRRGYEIREGTTWAGGIVLASEISANSSTHRVTYDGTYTYHIKAIDLSGNYSTNSTSYTLKIVGVIDLINIVYQKEELDDFISGIATASNVTDNLIWQGSGNTVGLHVPHALTDSGVSKWSDSGSSLTTEYSGTTAIDGSYISPVRDIGKSAASTLRLFKSYISEILRVTDRTYPSRVDLTYPEDTDVVVTSNSTVVSYYKVSQTSPLAAISWTTYTAPILDSFRYYQRKDFFELDSDFTTLAYTSIYTYVDVPDQIKAFNNKAIGASGTTFDLRPGRANSLGVTIFISYAVACSVLTDPYFYMIKNKSGTSFFVTLFDDTGTKRAGEVDMILKGF